MIKGFEEYTEKLTEEEKDIAQTLADTFNKYKVGEENAVTSKEIAQGMWDKKGVKLTGAKIRKMINYIRINRLCINLISSSRGYWIEPDEKRVIEYVYSLGQRANAIHAVAKSFIKPYHGSAGPT